MGLPRLQAEPQPGDHLLVFRGGYTHHGIWLGDGQVAHKVAGSGMSGVAFSSADQALRGVSGSVVLTDLHGFCPEASSATDWSHLRVVAYRLRFAREDTVALAKLASRDTSQSYRLLGANCEHFAAFCCTGEHVSLQVLVARGLVHRFGALTAGLIAGTAVAARLEANERTRTVVTYHRGKGVRGALGLGRRRVVVQETVVETQRVLLQAGLIAAAAVAVFSLVSKLEAAVHAARVFRFALRDDAGTVAVVTLRRHRLRRGGLPGLVDAARAALGATGQASAAAEQRICDAAGAPLTEKALRGLSHCCSLRLCG